MMTLSVHVDILRRFFWRGTSQNDLTWKKEEDFLPVFLLVLNGLDL